MSPSSIRIALPALLACLGLGSCRYLHKPVPEPVPISQRLTWDGAPADEYAASPASAADSLIDSGLAAIHEFRFAGADSTRLLLREYRRDYLAYEAFQKRASLPEMSDGFFRKGESLVFYHGPYFGELWSANGGMIPAHFLKEKLSFQGQPLFLAPPEFASFPLLGRIPQSERVFVNQFLGRNWHGPVFSVSYRCHSDTATVFHTKAQDFNSMKSWFQEGQGRVDTLGRGQGSEMLFQGMDEFRRPMVIWVYWDAVVGVEGCADSDLALDYARKLGKIRAIWSKP